MKWTDQLFIFGMAALVLVSRLAGVDGEFLALAATLAGIGVGYRLGKGAA